MTGSPSPVPFRRHVRAASVSHAQGQPYKFKPGSRKFLVTIGWDKDTGTWTDDSPVGRFMSAIRIGNYTNSAAAYAGVSQDTISRAIATGRQARPDGYTPEDRDEIPEHLRVFVDFICLLEEREAQSEVELVALWRTQAKNDYRAARDLLARRHPSRWADQSRVAVTGPDGGAVQVVSLSQAEVAHKIADDPDARELANRLLAMVAPMAPPIIEATTFDEDDE